MVSLASLIDQHYVFKNNPAEAKYALLTRAAELAAIMQPNDICAARHAAVA
jgi:hypothetical protein